MGSDVNEVSESLQLLEAPIGGITAPAGVSCNVIFKKGESDMDKFDDVDRGKVISEMEKALQITLTKVGSRRKYLQDQNGVRYLLVGGDVWHGLPEDVVTAELIKDYSSKIVVASKLAGRMDVFVGSLKKLIDCRSDLSFTKDSQFVFKLRKSGQNLIVKEVPSCSLEKFISFQYQSNNK